MRAPPAAVRTALLLAALLTCLPARSAPRIEVQALFKDRAVLLIEGKRRVLRSGQTSPEGVTLVSATSRGAVLQVAGERREVALGNRIGADFSGPREQRVRVRADHQGMYLAEGSINGVPVRFVLDTGSTLLSISEPLAARLGLDYRAGSRGETVTAAGVVPMWRVHLARVTLGEIELRQVEASVLEGDFPETPLLGNSFLSRVEMTRRGDVVELVRTF